MKKYIEPSTTKWMIEPDLVLDPQTQIEIHGGTSGNGGLTKELDWEEEDDEDGFGW